MSTLDAIVEEVEELQEPEQQQILTLVREFKTSKADRPFAPLTREQVISDIELSEKQFDEGKGMDAKQAVYALKEKYGLA